MGNQSDFLFARPSFAEGMGRAIDFGNTLAEYNRSLTPEQADLIALWMDWRAIGGDMRQQLRELRGGVKQVCSPSTTSAR